MTKPLYIFDLDGTLALIEHRRHYVDRPSLKCYDCGGANRSNCVQCADLDEGFKPDWTAFYAACHLDEPNKPVIATLNRLHQAGADIWIFSGRSDEVREKTVSWLTKHVRLWEYQIDACLCMRRAGDYTPDDVLKKQWLDNMLVEDSQRLVAVFEDRDRMVAMWRAAGVPCFQVAPGDF